MRTKALILDNGDVRVVAPTRSVASESDSDDSVPASDVSRERDWSRLIAWSSSTSMTRIECDPAALSPPAFARLCDWLRGLPAKHTIWLQYHDGGEPAYDIRFGRSAAEQALTDRRATAGRACKPLLRHIVGATGIPDHAGNLRHLWSIWAEKRDKLDRDVARRLSEANDMRIIILRPTSDRGHIIQGHGGGYDPCISRWLATNVGAPIDHWPDQGYGDATERAYQEVSTRDAPVHDEIDCVVVWPGGKRNRRTYRRLLLPFKTVTNQKVLVVSTRVDPTIDLRGATHDRSTARA